MPRCTTLLLLPLLLAADWTRFRGPEGRGQADDREVPTRWAAENVLWKVAVPGAGHSSPIVVKGRVLFQSATERERTLLCYDADKGGLLWKQTAPGGPARTHARNTLASGTACSDGERVFITFWDGKVVTLAAYGLDGKPLWTKDLGRYQTDGKTNRHGAGFSPITHGGKVFVNFDTTGAAAVLAFDARTGNKVWEQKRTAYRTCYSTPFILQRGRPHLVVVSTQGPTFYEPDNGKETWRFDWPFPIKPLRTVGSAVADGDMLFAISGDGDGSRHMIGVRLPRGDATARLAWSKAAGTPYVPTPLALDGKVYGVTDDGVALCFDGPSGDEHWRQRLSGGATASPVLVTGRVFAPDEKGVVHVFAASPKGFDLLARNKLGEPVYASPAVANGRLYVRGTRHLFCIGPAPKGGAR